MTIADYLKQRADHLTQAGRRIKDFQVFDFNYMPEQPLMREEVKPIIDACLRYLSTGIANHVFIFGSRGSGKTLTVKHLGRLLAQQHQAEVLYANCRQHNTSFKILAHLLGVRPRGCSLDELWHRFTEAHSGRLLLILDEVDLISEKDRNKDILYLIGRSPRNYMTILLSNHPKFLNTLDESVRSSLQTELIHFRNYDAQEIMRILKDRALLGLKDMPDETMAKIAALTTRATNSDVRVAIKTLYYAALEESGDIEDFFNRARRDLITDILADLSDRNLMILKAVANIQEPFVKAVYEEYRRLSIQEHEEPFSYVYFYANLSYLQSIGLLVLVATKVGRTYTNRIQALFDAEMLRAIWGMRFGTAGSEVHGLTGTHS
ncbi:MAG TPA: NACHT domain-containing protein [Planctomycetota bacterium]|nr:NACHT domain-containing protein [Planctomycetota bacterium]